MGRSATGPVAGVGYIGGCRTTSNSQMVPVVVTLGMILSGLLVEPLPLGLPWLMVFICQPLAFHQV